MLELLYWLTGAIVLVTALLSLVRLGRGPATIDRAVAVDVLTVAALAAGALISIVSNRAELVVFVILLALTGFFSAVVVGRFVQGIDSHEGVLSAVEAELEASRIEAEAVSEVEAEAEALWLAMQQQEERP
ncbi:MAG: monovalent cation/H+ antiporter complex subunit F [Actinomycetaceae bacterium]|nr:monovalent cation/H+ antiporter complex subunit F [Actinomycetaceae bacterium]